MKPIKKMVISSILMALGIVFAFVVHSVGGVAGGQLLLPMHFPILFIGFICGARYGAICGVLLPLINFVLFGRPPFPSNVAMCLELACYGVVVGLLRNRIHPTITLVIAMLLGRVVNLFTTLTICGIQGKAFAIIGFLTTNFANGILGIVLQLLIIPSIIYALYKAELLEKGSIKWSLRRQEE